MALLIWVFIQGFVWRDIVILEDAVLSITSRVVLLREIHAWLTSISPVLSDHLLSLICLPFSAGVSFFLVVLAFWLLLRYQGARCHDRSFLLRASAYTFELRHDKTNNVAVRPAKTQISLGICPLWSESSLDDLLIAKDRIYLHADSEDSDQTGRMPRLIWVFIGRIVILLVLSRGGSFAEA